MKLTDRFRPKADYALLRSLNDVAWERESKRLTAGQAQVGEAVARQLESEYPAADMEVLARYGCCESISGIHVHVSRPGTTTWSQMVRLEFGRNVRVPRNHDSRYCGGERFSRDPNRGLKAETIAKIKAGQHDLIKSWDAFCAEQEAKERSRIPEEHEQWFFDILEARSRYSAEYQRALAIPKTDGKYPTWGQIGEQFPTLGQVIYEQQDGARLRTI